MRRKLDRLERKSGLLVNRRLENLSNTVNELFQKAVQNENILRRYQRFELALLDLQGLDDLLDTLLRNSLEYFQLDQVELWLYDPQGILAELLTEEYLLQPGLRLLSRPDPIIQLYGKQPTVRLVSTSQGESLPVFTDKDLHSVALLPLIRQGVMVGSLHFGVRGYQRFTSDKSTDFISHLASIVSVCLENAVNQERLNRLSMYDMLTQVKNRRAFHLALDKEVSRGARSGDPLSLLFVDLDYFKQVNDNYGHPMGDKVLKSVALYINDMLRKTDHVCRYGGEEFALVLPNCSRQRAMAIGERIRQQIAALAIDCDPVAGQAGVSSINITLSMGVCCWEPQPDVEQGHEAEIAKGLIACSDKGVYLSKAAGRNCIHYVPMQDISETALVSSME